MLSMSKTHDALGFQRLLSSKWIALLAVALARAGQLESEMLKWLRWIPAYIPSTTQ